LLHVRDFPNARYERVPRRLDGGSNLLTEMLRMTRRLVAVLRDLVTEDTLAPFLASLQTLQARHQPLREVTVCNAPQDHEDEDRDDPLQSDHCSEQKRAHKTTRPFHHRLPSDRGNSAPSRWTAAP